MCLKVAQAVRTTAVRDMSEAVVTKASHGDPTRAPWVKNLTAAAEVTIAVWVQHLAQCNGLKDRGFLQLWHHVQLQLKIQSLDLELPYTVNVAII